MRELLQEAAKWMDETLNKSGHTNMEALMLLDEGRALFTRITAALAEPELDAMELVDQLAAIINSPFDTVENRKAKAAALIESYGRRVPRAFVEEIYRAGYSTGYVQPTTRNRDKEIAAIAAKYGVKIKE